MKKICLFLALCGSVQATTIVDDRFIDGGFTNGADALDMNWQLYTSGPTLSIESDNTTGPNEGGNDNALNINVIGQGFRGVYGVLGSPQSLAVGDSLSLTYDLRFSSGNPGNNTNAIRFGLYNSNSTPSAADAFGYTGRLGTGTNNTVTAAYESGTDGTVLGGNDITELTGTDSRSTNGSLVNHQNSVHLGLNLTRTGATSMLVEVFQNNALIWTGTDNSASAFSFDMTALGTGTNNTVFRVDNITLTYTAIPEPGTLALVGVSLGALLLFRRRRA